MCSPQAGSAADDGVWVWGIGLGTAAHLQTVRVFCLGCRGSLHMSQGGGIGAQGRGLLYVNGPAQSGLHAVG